MAYKFDVVLTKEMRRSIRNALGMDDVEDTEDDWVSVEYAESIYNDQRGHLNNNYGKKTSEETKAKISASNKGKKTFGHKHSDESKAKMSEAKKGKPSNRKGKEAWNKGSKMSAEFCENTRKGKLGVKFSEEAKKNMSECAKNRPKVECYKCGKLMNALNLKRWHGDKCKHGV